MLLQLTYWDGIRNSDSCWVRASAIDAVVPIAGTPVPFTQLVLEGSGFIINVCEAPDAILASLKEANKRG